MQLLSQNRSLLDLLRELFNDIGEKSGDEILFFCTQHHHHKRKLQINLTTHKWHCWVCDLGGRNLFQLFKKYNFDLSLLRSYDKDEVFTEAKEEKQKEELVLPRNFRPLCYRRNSIQYNNALNYLFSRSISELDILRYKIGYCVDGEYSNRVIIPSFDKSGKLNYFVTRSLYEETAHKYLNCNVEKSEIVFNELNVDFTKPVNICEGVFDMFVCGENTIPILGSSIGKEVIRKMLFTSKVYLVLDPDTYSFEDDNKSKLLKIAKKIRKYITDEIYLVDVRPLKDIGKTTHDDFLKRRDRAIKIDDEFLFKVKLGAIR